MNNKKNSLIRTESEEELHQRLLKMSLWDSLSKDRKKPLSFAFKINPHDFINRALAVDYISRARS